MEALKMETPMTEWNNDRLDELNERVKEGFANIQREMKDGFAQAGERFATREEMGEVRMELRRLNERFDRLLHMLTLVAWGFAGALVAALAAVLVAAWT
jgi:predicted nuclease with TOPRIM domain